MLLNVSYRRENFKTTFYTWITEQGWMVLGEPCRHHSKNQLPHPSTPADMHHHQIRENKRNFLAVLVSNLISDGEDSGCVGAKV